MAFISPLPRIANARPSARFRMQETSEKSVIAPLNGDKTHEMKQIYPMTPGAKAPVCRCWQSGKLPLCDGSHNKFNKETGSHVGPLVINVAKE